MMFRSASLMVVVLLFALMPTYLHCTTLAESTTSVTYKPLVVTTTTVLGSIVKDLAGDSVIIEVIASPSACPAHYDVRPSDVEAFRKAVLILAHGVEPWVNVLREASGTRAPLVVIRGGWNTPRALKDVYNGVARALKDVLGIDVSTKLELSLKSIDETESWLKSFAMENAFIGKPVVAMRWQKDFVEFLGFKVVATYGPPETVSVREYEEVIANATRGGAVLVIDNLQSGVALGEGIARSVGAVHVALTNFPWIQPGISNVTEMMKYNARLLAKALSETSLRSELMRARNDLEMWRAFAVASSGLSLILAIVVVVLTIKLRRVRGGR